MNNKPEIHLNENGLEVSVYGDKLLDYTSKYAILKRLNILKAYHL